MSKRSPGLYFRRRSWHIDKTVYGQRILENCHTDSLEQAEKILAKRIEDIRQTQIFGLRPSWTFVQAATKYLNEHEHKRSIHSDVIRLKLLVEMFGHLPLLSLHMGTLEQYITRRRRDNVTAGTINHGLKVVRRILNLAASEWFDDNGVTWLATAPKIRLLPDKDKRQPHPLNWDEQERLFKVLPVHLQAMALFAINTGCRDAEICGLRWCWEQSVPALQSSIFIIPGEYVKNAEERLIVLNRTAQSVIETQRGKHADYVFVYQGRRINKMLNTGWKKARIEAGLPGVRVHDLKHTYGRRLRAAGVDFETRQDLLGHKSGRITTHYSAPELRNLIEAANTVCEMERGRPELVVLRRLNVS